MLLGLFETRIAVEFVHSVKYMGINWYHLALPSCYNMWASVKNQCLMALSTGYQYMEMCSLPLLFDLANKHLNMFVMSTHETIHAFL